MDPAVLWVTLTGVVLVIAVNLYFFSPPRPAAVQSTAAEGPQEARITVRSGYDPAVVELQAGRPVRLIFRREEVEGCSDTVLMPEWEISQRLPAFEDTVVEFTPLKPGEYEFTCGMGMLRGRVRVRQPDLAASLSSPSAV